MKIKLHRNFVKSFTKLPFKIQEKFKERRNLFLADQFNPILNNHPLSGKYKGYRSINITGNIRVIYKLLDEHTILFTEIGTHNKLYL